MVGSGVVGAGGTDSLAIGDGSCEGAPVEAADGLIVGAAVSDGSAPGAESTGLADGDGLPAGSVGEADGALGEGVGSAGMTTVGDGVTAGSVGEGEGSLGDGLGSLGDGLGVPGVGSTDGTGSVGAGALGVGVAGMLGSPLLPGSPDGGSVGPGDGVAVADSVGSVGAGEAEPRTPDPLTEPDELSEGSTSGLPALLEPPDGSAD